FFFFYWYLGEFPVGIENVGLMKPSAQAARRIVAEHGRELIMDYSRQQNSVRTGDWGKLFLFVPGILLGGDPSEASSVAANRIVWVVALLAICLGFAAS